METKEIFIRPYISLMEIIGIDDEPYRRQDQLLAGLFSIVESLLARTGLEKYSGYVFLKTQHNAVVRLARRQDPAEICDLATLAMLMAEGEPLLRGRIRIGLHYGHQFECPERGLVGELPSGAGHWTVHLKFAAKAGEILMSKMLWMELCDHERIGPRLRFARSHKALTGFEEELYELTWVGLDAETYAFGPLPKPWLQSC